MSSKEKHSEQYQVRDMYGEIVVGLGLIRGTCIQCEELRCEGCVLTDVMVRSSEAARELSQWLLFTHPLTVPNVTSVDI